MHRSSTIISVGIVIICIGFILSNCGVGPSLKTQDPDAGAFAIYFNGLEIDGENKYVDAGQIPLADTDFTVEAWIKTSVSTGPVFSRGTEDKGDFKFTLYIEDNFAKFSAANIADVASSTTMINDNLWHHIAGVYSNAPHNHGAGVSCLTQTHFDIYVDGVWENCTDATDSGYPDDMNCDVAGGEHCSNRIGYSTSEVQRNLIFEGVIDEVRLWNVARNNGLENLVSTTTDQITVWWNQKLTSAADPNGNLLGYWRFDEGTGATAGDRSGQNHPGSKLLCLEDCGDTPITAPWAEGWVAGCNLTAGVP